MSDAVSGIDLFDKIFYNMLAGPAENRSSLASISKPITECLQTRGVSAIRAWRRTMFFLHGRSGGFVGIVLPKQEGEEERVFWMGEMQGWSLF